MTVYESVIEITLEPAFSRFIEDNDKLIAELRALRKKHVEVVGNLDAIVFDSQERWLLDLLWARACLLDDNQGSTGYVGSFHNCVFDLLYGVFGADVIGYLFDRDWVPSTKVDPFLPNLFLDRLSVLERAAANLQDHLKTPVMLQETRPFMRPGMGPHLQCFVKEHHRLLLESSLRELRDFGELGLSLQRSKQRPTVSIHIFIPEGDLDPEILKFAAACGQGSRRARGKRLPGDQQH